MNSLWKAIGFSGSSIPNFPYTIDEDTAKESRLSSAALVPWTMRPATRDDDGGSSSSNAVGAGGSGPVIREVTVFSYGPLSSSTPAVQEMARNVLRKGKTLMLPGFLRVLDATEYKDTIYMATEPVRPLHSVIHCDNAKVEFYEEASGEKFNNAVANGLKTIATAINGIHKHNMVHANISDESIFVTRGGEWRVFGLELVSAFDAAPDAALFRKHAAMLPEVRRQAITADSGSSGNNSSPIYSIDSWGLGCLIYTVFGNNKSSASPSVAELRGCRSMPRPLQSAFMGLTSTAAKSRMALVTFLTECEFVTNSEYVQLVQELDHLAVMDGTDRDACYRRLAAQLDHFPLCACKHIILERLTKALSFGGGSATVLEPILKIGARLSEQDFSLHVAPFVVSMFASQDHMVRCRLLSAAPQYAPLLPKVLVNEKIYPQYITGFSNRHADIRELTVRALVAFAPLLNEAILKDDVPKHIAMLQQDREGPIRTNATICLSLIGKFLPEAVRSKTLVNAFGRMLKDPFIPSRTAALRGLLSTADFYTPVQWAELLLPAVAPCTIDSQSSDVRSVALQIIECAVKRLRDNHDEMPPDPVASPAATAGSSPAPSASTPTTSTTTARAKDSINDGNFPFGGGSSAPVATTGGVALFSGASSKGTASLNATTTSTPAKPTIASVVKTTTAPAPAAAPQKGGGWGSDDDDGFGDSGDDDKKATFKSTTSTSPAPATSSTTSSAARPVSASASGLGLKSLGASRGAMSLGGSSGNLNSLNATASGEASAAIGAPRRVAGTRKGLGLGLGSTISKAD